jgi:hypothetical protein
MPDGFHEYCMDLARKFNDLCSKHWEAANFAADSLEMTYSIAEWLVAGYIAPNYNGDLNTALILWEGYYAPKFKELTGRADEPTPIFPY